MILEKNEKMSNYIKSIFHLVIYSVAILIIAKICFYFFNYTVNTDRAIIIVLFLSLSNKYYDLNYKLEQLKVDQNYKNPFER